MSLEIDIRRSHGLYTVLNNKIYKLLPDDTEIYTCDVVNYKKDENVTAIMTLLSLDKEGFLVERLKTLHFGDTYNFYYFEYRHLEIFNHMTRLKAKKELKYLVANNNYFQLCLNDLTKVLANKNLVIEYKN